MEMLGEKAPGRVSFKYVIRRWTRNRRCFDIDVRAMQILRIMEHYQNSVDATVCQDSKSYAVVMDAISVKKAKLNLERCLRHSKSARLDPNRNGQEGRRLLNPITAWANLSRAYTHAPFEVEKVLQHIFALKLEGNDAVAPDAHRICLSRELE